MCSEGEDSNNIVGFFHDTVKLYFGDNWRQIFKINFRMQLIRTYVLSFATAMENTMAVGQKQGKAAVPFLLSSKAKTPIQNSYVRKCLQLFRRWSGQVMVPLSSLFV